MDKVNAEKLKEYNELKEWSERESLIHSIKILVDLNYPDKDIEKDLNITSEQLKTLKKGL